jgi:hypothetical protein
MSYLTERNPVKALVNAKTFLVAFGRRQELEEMLQYLPLTTPKQAAAMDKQTIELHIRRIAIECKSETELAQRLTDELGFSGALINWYEPTDQTGVEARDLVRAFGGLISKNGAMVSVMIYTLSDDVIIV